ncbi:MAG: MBL fold metallo-hydrolase [Acetivibrio sp.]
MKNKQKKWMVVCFIISILLTGCRFPWKEWTEKKTDIRVYFLDVAQGNSILVEDQGEFMLIDGGDRDYSSFVVRYLKNRGVKELKYVVISHYDKDHLNGVVGVLNTIPCKTVIAPNYATDSKIYKSYRNVMKKKKLEEIYPSAGDTFSIGEAEFTIVCPKDYHNILENDNSIGLRLVHGKNSFLICGDAGFASEEEMIRSRQRLESDVYMASHHGSRSSSGKEFLAKVNPSYILVSCGVNNEYGHPTKTFLKRAKETDAELLRTDLQGTLIATGNGKEIRWNKEPCNDFRSAEQIENGEHRKLQEKKKNIRKVDHYILNTSSHKIHLLTCSSVGAMSEKNKKKVTDSIKNLKKKGYQICGICRKEILGETKQ